MAFELLNEVTEYRMAEAWNRISTETIKLIHDIVPEKTIIIGGIYNSSIVGLTLLPKPVDDNVEQAGYRLCLVTSGLSTSVR